MARDFLNVDEQVQVKTAVANAEVNTSGEIRLFLEEKCKGDVLDRAAFVFEKLEMHKTEGRNGVLFYLSTEDHHFAILGDAGINKVVPDNFWEEVRDVVIDAFKQGNYADGLCRGIEMAGSKLKEFFPYQSDDVNELSDDIAFGDEIKEV